MGGMADPSLGTQIKRARERRHITQQQLADIVGVDRKTVDNWENDRTYPRNRLGALHDWAPELRDEETLDDTERALLSIPDLPKGAQAEFLRIYEGSPLGKRRAG